MKHTYIIILIALVLLVSMIPLLALFMSSERQNKYLNSFYNACNELRDGIHTSTSRAECIVLLDEIAFVRESYENLIPPAVLDKELKLLGVLLNKKSKKLK